MVRSNDDDICHLSLFVNLSVSCEHLAFTNRWRSTIESQWNSRIQLFFLLSFLFSSLSILNFLCITASADQQVFAKRFFFLSRPHHTLPPERASHCKGLVTLPKRMNFRKGSKRPFTPNPRPSEWSLSLEIMCMHFILSGHHTSSHICNHIYHCLTRPSIKWQDPNNSITDAGARCPVI